MKTNVNVLGTVYRIEIRNKADDKYLSEQSVEGYCSEDAKLIVLDNLKDIPDYVLTDAEKENHIKSTLRHELVHAFLNESGLSWSANQFGNAWAKNEEMVDWFAIQSPKIFEAFRQVECI